jgi:predicted acylesterase/phospholipase RssA
LIAVWGGTALPGCPPRSQKRNSPMGLHERISRPGPKKLLAIDGGGIRGVLALGILQKIEDVLKSSSKSSSFCLADYFDYIAGTSTGAIIAAVFPWECRSATS